MIESEQENVTSSENKKEEKTPLKKEKSKESLTKSSESKKRSESTDHGSLKKDASTDPIEESGTNKAKSHSISLTFLLTHHRRTHTLTL